MAPPSSFLLSGIFALSGGDRLSDQRHYTNYLSSIDFVNPNDFLNVSVRKYTPLAESLYEDQTLVFVVAKAVLPTDEEGILDAIYCAQFESFQAEDLPQISTHVANAAGTVTSVDNGPILRTFTLSVSEYVRSDRRNFSIKYVCVLIFPALFSYADPLDFYQGPV